MRTCSLMKDFAGFFQYEQYELFFLYTNHYFKKVANQDLQINICIL